MYLIRNGQVRPMTRDVRLPNGRTVTRDGFVVQRDGRRTELTDGRGCTLLGEPVAVASRPDGRVVLGAAMAPSPSASAAEAPLLVQLQRWWGQSEKRGKGHAKKRGKHKGRRDD